MILNFCGFGLVWAGGYVRMFANCGGRYENCNGGRF